MSFLIFVKPNYEKYKQVANVVREIFHAYDPEFEAYSLDEAYLNITKYVKETLGEDASLGDARGVDAISKIVFEMRSRITAATNGLTCSAGIGPTRMIAKVGSDINKPNGQFALLSTKQEVVRFVRELKIRKIPGIGRVTEKLLHGIGVSNVQHMWERRIELSLLFRPKSFAFFLRVALGITSSSRGDEGGRGA